MAKRKKAPSQGLNFVRNKYPYLIKTFKERRKGFHHIKEQLPFAELCNAIDHLDKNLNSKFKEIIYGNPLPKSYDDLGVCEEYPYLGNSIISETNWILISIRKYTYELNLFIVYKNLFEQSLLIGDYIEAEKHLDKIEKEICFSLWTLENRFLVKELRNESLASKELLSTFNFTNNSEGYTKTLAHFLSLRAEKALSVNRYMTDLNLSLSKIRGRNKDEHNDYYRFKLNFLNTDLFS